MFLITVFQFLFHFLVNNTGQMRSDNLLLKSKMNSFKIILYCFLPLTIIAKLSILCGCDGPRYSSVWGEGWIKITKCDHGYNLRGVLWGAGG